MAVLPISLDVTGTWLEITSDVIPLNLIDEEVLEVYHNGSGLIEVIIDTLGTEIIDSSFDGKGRIIEGSQFLTFPYLTTTRFYVRRIKYAAKPISQIQLRKQLNNVNINSVDTFHGALNIHDADVHIVPINEFFHKHTGVSTTLTVAIVGGVTTIISVVDVTGFNVDDKIQIQNGQVETTHPTITAIDIVLNTLTLDRPIDISFSIGDNVESISSNIKLEIGTLSNPISYRVVPDLNQIWHIQSFIIALTHGSAGDDSRLGDILDGITNGVILRGFNGTSNQHSTITNWKQNKDIRLDAFSLSYSDKAGGGNFGTSADGALKQRTGAIARLDGATGDYLEILVQDDLTSLITFEIKAQGHLENF